MTTKLTWATTAPEELLRTGTAALGLALNSAIIRQFLFYSDELLKWNARINLTGIKSAQEVVVRHFLDSLAVWPWVKDLDSLADIGTGGGFPGLPLKLILPDLSLTLIEPTGKKTAFLNFVVAHLRLTHVAVRQVHLTSPEARGWGPRFQGVITRATFPLAHYLELGAPLVKPGGRLLAMKGPRLDEAEWQAGVDRAAACGCGPPAKRDYILPIAEEGRVLVSWPKL